MLRIPRRQTAMPKIAAFCKLASCSLAASTLPLSAVSLPASSSSFSLQKPPLIAFVHSCVSRRGRKHFALSSKSSIVSLGFSGLSVTRGHCSTPQFPFGEVMDLHTDYSVMRMSHTTSSDIRNDSEITVEGMDGERAISTNQILDGDNHLLNSNSGDEIMFDEQQISSFEDALEVILLKRNVIRDFKKNEKDLDIVKQHLIDRKRKLPRWDIQQFLQSPQPNPSNATDNYNGTVREDLVPYTKQKLRERRQMYLDNTGLTVPQHRLATVLLAHLSDHCAKTSNPQPLYVGWEKLLEAGMTPLERTLSTSMYVFSLDEDADAAGNGRDVASEVAMFHDALYEPTEKTIALLVKSLVSRGDAAGAENLLDGIVVSAIALKDFCVLLPQHVGWHS